MRSGRSLLVLLALAVGVGAYIYFVEAERDPSGAPETRDKVFTVESPAIEEMEIRSATGQATTLKKTGTDWQIVAPVTAAADSTTGTGATPTGRGPATGRDSGRGRGRAKPGPPS